MELSHDPEPEAEFVGSPVLLELASVASIGPDGLESFEAAALELGIGPADERALLAAVGEESRSATRAEAVVCTQFEDRVAPNCEIRDDGAFVTVDSVKTTVSGFEAFVTTRWTERRSDVSWALGAQSRILSFTRSSAGWHLVGNRLYLRT